MVEVRLGDAEIKKYLRKAAEKEKEEFKVISDRESPSHERSAAIKKMAQPREFLSGFLYAVTLIHGEEAGKYYEKYFFQARSDEGVVE